MIAYQLQKYLDIVLTGKTWRVNTLLETERVSCILVQDAGGTPDAEALRRVRQVRILSLQDSPAQALYEAMQVFLELHSLWDIELPGVVIGLITLAAVRVAQISPIQEPTYIGVENGKHVASFSVRLITA